MSQGQVEDVKETATYCDTKHGHNMRFIGSISGLSTFLSNDLISVEPYAPSKFLAANTTALKRFAEVLLDCADSYGVSKDAVHMFYDASGSTIAFNKNKALFFNHRYFESLHLPSVEKGQKADALVYWSVVMSHELA